MFNTDEYQFDAYTRSRSNLENSSIIFLSFSVFIVLFFSLTIISQMALHLNFKRAHLVETILLSGEEHIPESLWLSVNTDDGKVIINTFDQKNFVFDEREPSTEDLEALQLYFDNLVKQFSVGSILEEKIVKHRSFVTLALDRRIKYGHLKPILEILAQAGLSEYGFETKASYDE